MLKHGKTGEDVQTLQNQLTQLGYEIGVDGDFGKRTEWAVKNIQAMFGYDVDGVAGPATQKLIEAQVGYGWNAKSADAQQKALSSQDLA